MRFKIDFQSVWQSGTDNGLINGPLTIEAEDRESAQQKLMRMVTDSAKAQLGTLGKDMPVIVKSFAILEIAEVVE